MKFSAKALLFLAGCTLVSMSAGVAPAHAGQLYNNWNYSIDSFNDGSDLGSRGSSSNYEFYGMAIKATADRVFVGINSNLGLGGQYSSGAQDKYIHYGDLFLNFTGNSLAKAEGSLFAIKFDAGNDSGVNEVGVYGNVVSQNVTATNAGFRTMDHHRNWANQQGTASMGDLGYREVVNGDFYFQQNSRAVSTSIRTGTFLGGISLLGREELSALGLNFTPVDAGVQGRHTFGFSFDRGLLPDGDFIAHLFAECINDGLALRGALPTIVAQTIEEDPESVPEPSLAAGLFVLGGLVFLKRRSNTANA